MTANRPSGDGVSSNRPDGPESAGSTGAAETENPPSTPSPSSTFTLRHRHRHHHLSSIPADGAGREGPIGGLPSHPRAHSEEYHHHTHGADTRPANRDVADAVVVGNDGDAATPARTKHPDDGRYRGVSASSSGRLFPPLYNRPLRMVPPSPSLSLVFRPSFDGSRDVDDGVESEEEEDEDEDGMPVSSGRFPRRRGTSGGRPGRSGQGTTTTKMKVTTARDRARTGSSVPAHEYYGFALYLLSSVTFGMYLLWAAIPSSVLHWVGIYYYPNRWWAVAVPAWITVTILYIYVSLACYNAEVLTLPVESVGNLVDEAACVAAVGLEGGGGGEPAAVGRGRRSRAEWLGMWDTGTDAVLDVPIGGVCEILYS